MTENLLCESPAESVRVVRFLRPDFYSVLYLKGHEYDNIADTPLYQDLHAEGLAGLPDGGTLVLNFGLVDVFPSAFMRLLFRVREDVKAKNGRLLFCCHTPHTSQSYNVMGGPKTFDPVLATEAEAVRVAKK